MDNDYGVGRKVKCIKQPEELSVNLLGLPGKITGRLGERCFEVDFGSIGHGSWYLTKDQINLLQGG